MNVYIDYCGDSRLSFLIAPEIPGSQGDAGAFKLFNKKDSESEFEQLW